MYETSFGGYTIPLWNHQNSIFTFFKSPFTSGYTSIQDKVLNISEENGSGKTQLLANYEVFVKNLKPKNKYKITRNDGETILPASCKYFLRGEKVLIK